ncbi:UPF0743 protein [[Candida] railenensis]|uniref:UPF0743 protein n=1 Tax=[Candida] railenensis TaxID=45579 RepID=A0A9P0QR32_9ASCO|nr:UPF0743 protein [[Candida] railenensis]
MTNRPLCTTPDPYLPAAMVSFSCENCNDTVVKKKLDQHQQRCHGAYFTCIDCSVTFYNNDHKKHTSCISEAEKYEKALYKGPKKKQQQQQLRAIPAPVPEPKKIEPTPEPKKASKKESKDSKKESKKDSKKSKSLDLSKYLKAGQSENLYKVIKKISDEKSQDKKDLLKKLSLVLGEDGNISVKLN